VFHSIDSRLAAPKKAVHPVMNWIRRGVFADVGLPEKKRRQLCITSDTTIYCVSKRNPPQHMGLKAGSEWIRRQSSKLRGVYEG
jgi:hypothetical protein